MFVDSSLLTPYAELAVALGAGLLVGTERGWQERETPEGERIAGIRTFGLLGLLGGLVGLLTAANGSLVLGLAFAALVALCATVYAGSAGRDDRGRGITTLVAVQLTFVLGALSTLGHPEVAASVAVVSMVLLGLKPTLHSWLRKLEFAELKAAAQLLLMSLVALPLLPDESLGPWGALNPYEIWWMVVLIATISFVGYFAVRVLGQRRGMIWTSLFAGLASSTALSFHFAKASRKADPNAARLLSGGILLACATMFPRLAVLMAVTAPGLLPVLVVPLGAMAIPTVVVGVLNLHRAPPSDSATAGPINNPLELKAALQFGAVLAAVLLASEAVRAWIGEQAVLAVAAVAGLVDVNAMTLSLAKMRQQGMAEEVAVMGVLVIASVNCISKAVIACVWGNPLLRLRCAAVLSLSALVGLAWCASLATAPP